MKLIDTTNENALRLKDLKVGDVFKLANETMINSTYKQHYYMKLDSIGSGVEAERDNSNIVNYIRLLSCFDFNDKSVHNFREDYIVIAYDSEITVKRRNG